MAKESSKMQKNISIILIMALIFTGLFSYPKIAYAEKTVLSEETYYHLDMGVHLAYEGSNWESKGYNLGDMVTPEPTVSFSSNVEVLDAYPLNSAKGSTFNFDDTTYTTTNIPESLKNERGTYKKAYDECYKDFVSPSMVANGTPSSSGNNITFSYKAYLNTPQPLEVVKKGFLGQDNEIWKLFGGKDKVSDSNVKAAIENALLQGKNGTAGDNRLYLIFCPTVIKYKKYVTVGDLKASLALPSSAKQGESYTASDTSIIDNSLTVEKAVVDKSVNGGAWEYVTKWPGTGAAGKNTGGTIDQSSTEVCTIRYRITVTTKDGQVSEDIKTINITDGRSIDATAILVLPEEGYAGHRVLAEDRSVFNMNGTGYSAKRAYAEGLADNSFVPLPSGSGTAEKDTSTTAYIVFPKPGVYDVRLEIRTVDGKVLTDTKTINIKKTPSIIDRLGGFQKQNRKQTLNIAVATSPGKPIVDYYVELLDLKTNQSVTLTPANPRVNNATIKTRAITSSGDEYWTNFTLEFLTKNTTQQEFRYTIYVKDSKDDTDIVQKVFTVAPDLPPVPKITIPDSFLRNKGTNIAEIMAEDSSTTDGDQLQRTWTVKGVNIKMLSSYQDKSFGTGQKVKYNKTGVGKETIQLNVKDVWTEPTLEEYVTDADHLEATTTAATEVLNIAPVVSLEPIFLKQANIALMVNQSSKAEIEAKVNSIRAALIEKGIESQIRVAPIAESYSGSPKLLMQKSWPAANGCEICNSTGITDSEYTFIEKCSQVYTSGGYDSCRGPVTVYALKGNINTGQAETVWSYTGGSSDTFTISEDKTEKYIFLHKGSQTILLNRNNGAYVATLNYAIGKNNFVSEDGERIYAVEDNCIMKYDSTTNTYTKVSSYGGSFAKLQNGKITFAGKESEYRYFIGQFDMVNEELKMTALPKFTIPNAGSYGTAIPLTAVDMDASGKLLLKAVYRNSNYDLDWYYCVYLDAKSGTAVSESYSGIRKYPDWGFVKDETDKAVGIYRLHLNGDEKSVSRNLYYRDIKANGTLGSEISLLSDSGRTSSLSIGNIMYARKHTAENKLYIIQETGEYYGAYATIPTATNGFTAIYNLASGSCSVMNSTAAFGGLSGCETGSTVIGNLMASTYNANQISGGRVTLKQIRANISQAQTEDAAVDKFVKDKINDLIYNVQDGVLDTSDLIQKTKDKLASAQTVKVSVTGDKGTISKKLILEPNKTYYCDYSIKPLSSTGAVTVNTTQIVNKATAAQNDYIVTDENLEDFSSATAVNPYFRFSDKSKIVNGWYSENISRQIGNNASAFFTHQESTISFYVPAGKKAALSFDYRINLAARAYQNDFWQNGFLIDGERWAKTMTSGSGHYTHPYLLSPGNHTITVFSQCEAASINDHSTNMDNLSVDYVESSMRTTVLSASGGSTRSFTASSDGIYKIKLYGPASNSAGGLVEASLDLKKGDVLTTYLGSQVPGATGARDGANGGSGNGYGNEGTYESKVSLNGKTVMIAGGGGGNGNPGSGDGEVTFNGNYGGTSQKYDYWDDPIPCSECGTTLGYHWHYAYHGTGGAAGTAGIGGASSITAGTAGGSGTGAAHWVLTPGRSEYYSDAGAGGNGGNGGASWTDGTVCKNVKLTAGGSYDQSRLIVTERVSPASGDYGVNNITSKTDGEGWINSKATIKSDPAVVSYASVDYTALDYTKAILQGFASRTNNGGTGFGENFTYTVPSGKVSLKNQFAAYFIAQRTAYGRGTFGYSAPGYTLLTHTDLNDQYVQPGSDVIYQYVKSGYKFTQEQATGSNYFYAVNSKTPGNYGIDGRYVFLNTLYMNLVNGSDLNSQINNGYYFFDQDASKVAYVNTTSSNEKTVTLTFDNQGAGTGEYLIKDLKFYYLSNGKKVYVNETNNDVSEYNKDWTASANVKIEGHIEPIADEPEDPPLVYKKGQLVAYNIFYSDYEKDSSKKQYWRYTHTPYNDGPHPQAATILDEDGNVVSSNGAILSSSIPRFYVDGKYTVEHWQEDNTNQTGDTSGQTDYSKYDKLSNVEKITFYVIGGGTAPWITSIKTIPEKLKEGDKYQLQIGVDDAEKDVLRLTTELYKDKKLIYTHKQTNIVASNGVYPYITTGYPPLAEGGKYDVVCTVRDWSGAGIGSYKFTVIPEGKITGFVNHTEQWNMNRMKYNLAKSGTAESPRAYNVFWSGEKFRLKSNVAGSPTSVTSQIIGYPAYKTNMHSTGAKNTEGETIYAGEMWDKTMINKWGQKSPTPLTFRFTAYYAGGTTKTHDVKVIVDNRDPYFKLHRYF